MDLCELVPRCGGTERRAMRSPLSPGPIALPGMHVCGVDATVALQRALQAAVVGKPPRDAALKVLISLHSCAGADGVKERLDTSNDRHRRTRLVHCCRQISFELM